MKSKIIYTVIFVSLFFAVSSTIIFLNTRYKNIFQFDFAPRPQNTQSRFVYVKPDFEKERMKILHEVRNELMDSLKTVVDNKTEQVESAVASNSVSINDYEKLKEKLDALEVSNSKILEKKQEEEKNETKEDLAYQEWIKDTAKMFESMDSKKAAKIMLKYSDNESRQIIYKMNKKKAAEILAELNPEDAQKITRPL